MMQLNNTTTAPISAATNATLAAPPKSNDSTATEAAVGAFEVAEENNDRGFGGNRWPRQETLALLKIRSDMGIAFRDANVKGPLWDEVSRKMAEHGYIRNSKKCKEKFENVYKYHKRTKEGRTRKSEGKTYRFFDQLEALETHYQPPQPQTQPLQPQPPPQIMPPIANMTLPSTSIPPYTQNISLFQNVVSDDFLSDKYSSSSSYSTSSDVEIGGTTTTKRKKKRKRKWKEFFERLMKQVVDKQEELQRKFLEAVEKREHERIIREESWRGQEIARINRERDILAQERSMSAAKDAAVMAFLQKLSEKPNPQPQETRSQMQLNNNSPHTTQHQPFQPLQPPLPPKSNNGGNQSKSTPSSSRWPKVEIEALIKLRTNLDQKYQENGPKGPLWEEISSGMKRLGFNRNSKRCKEKWENINKYFKKVKESNKKRPQDSKTCPYFHQLDALYKERHKFNNNNNNNNIASSSFSGLVKPDDNSVPLMVQPEQQWPPVKPLDHHDHENQSQPLDENFDEEEGTEEDYDDEEEEGEFEVMPSNNNITTNN
ncbi:unnamed protein product [Cochlearia groenlandica]